MILETTTPLYTQPYNLDATGFDFDSPEDFEVLAASCRDRFGLPVEEFEVVLLDGSDEDAELFKALQPTQANLTTWFEEIEPLELHEKAALFSMVTDGYLLSEALDVLDDAVLHEGASEGLRGNAHRGLWAPGRDAREPAVLL